MQIKFKSSSTTLQLYQAANGTIYINLGRLGGDQYITLTKEQIKQAGIESSVYDIKGFDINSYKQFYKL